MEWSDLSKMVGWDKRIVEYPDKKRLQELSELILNDDPAAMVELLTYHRFLPFPANKQQLMISLAISVSLHHLRRYLENCNYGA